MIYLDNAATSFPKPKRVIREVTKCITQYCGNPGRSSHKLSIAAADKIYETRELVADFLNIKKCENVIFTPNATYALNMVIKGLVNEKCHCIISDLEHNSVLRPLYKSLTKYGGEYSVFDTDEDICNSIDPLIRDDTKILISTLCSNVTGKIIDLNKLSSIAKKHDLKLIIDASQYIGHSVIDLSNIQYTALCSAGHKSLFGIQGSSFAVINDEELFDTLCEGGSGVDSFSTEMPILSPERYEAGTLATPAIVSLGAGIKYLNELGMEKIESRISLLTNILRYYLNEIPNIKIYGIENGIASFNLKDYPSSYVAELLDKNGIATRSGYHCVPLVHQRLGTASRGAVRASISILNTENEVYSLYKAIKKI